MPQQTMVVFLLGAFAAGAMLWVLLYPFLSGERSAEKRKENIARRAPTTRAAAVRTGAKSRREQVEETLKELETRSKKTGKVPLSTRLAQAGLSWSPHQFFLISATLGLCTVGAAMLAGGGWAASVVLGLVGCFGLPRWMLKFLKKRREKLFLAVFADAVDVIVRGVKAGLPLADCLKVIASDAQEPVKSEFQSIVDTQAIGMPISEACQKLYESVPLPEANFFGIVISIQQKAGGNLSEALGNLSRVLRDRKRMQAKIRAMSMEAKASAAIIGSLPPIVMALVYLTSPEYISMLWTTSPGRIMLVACGVWMTMGVLVMKKMINFDF